MTGLYALILYCTGTCPAWVPAPNGVLLYTNLVECEAKAAELSAWTTSVVTRNGKKVSGMKFKQTCATMYAEPKQLDRFFHLGK